MIVVNVKNILRLGKRVKLTFFLYLYPSGKSLLYSENFMRDTFPSLLSIGNIRKLIPKYRIKFDHFMNKMAQ